MLEIIDLFLKRFDKYIDSFLELLHCTRHEKVVESTAGVSFESMFDLLPITISMFMRQTKKHNVSLFREVFGLLNDIDNHFFDRSFIGSYLLFNQNGRLPLERVNGVGFVQLLFDVGIVI